MNTPNNKIHHLGKNNIYTRWRHFGLAAILKYHLIIHHLKAFPKCIHLSKSDEKCKNYRPITKMY
jgi:hypothetical protein